MSAVVPRIFHKTINEIVAGAVDPTEMPVETLAEMCRALNAAYRAGKEMVSDAQYDSLFVGALHRIAPDHPFLHSVEPEEDAFTGPTVRHRSPMLSTDKAYTEDELRAFFLRIQKMAASLGLDSDSLTYRVTAKLDGIAGFDDGTRLLTRGDGLAGTDITHVIEAGFEVVGGRGQGAGELVIEQRYFAEVLQTAFPDLKHPRNYITGFAGAKTRKNHHLSAAEAGALQFVPYATLPSWTGGADQFLSSWLDIFHDLRDECDYLTDGVVLELVGPEALKEAMGSTSHHHRWQVALKQKGKMADTIVENIRLQTGRTGRITPVLEISPIELEGCTNSNVTAHTAATLVRKGLGVGAEVRVSRAGGVIPTLEAVITPAADPLVVSECPSCGTAAEVDGEYMICPNTAECPAQAENRIRHWFQVLGNADLFGPVTVKRLVEAGYTDMTLVYALTEADFLALDFGPVQSRNLVAQLERSRRELVHDWKWLAAFGIRHLGRGDSRKLLSVYSLDEVTSLSAEQIEAVPGFGPITSPQIAGSFQRLSGVIAWMRGLGFNLEETPRGDALDGPLDGVSVVFTGAMQSGSRDEMKEQARALGAKVQSSVNGKTDFLVAGERVGARKMEAAQQMVEQGKLRILNEDDWFAHIAMIESAPPTNDLE